MDLSKLPRLSETDKHSPPPPTPGQPQELPPTPNPQQQQPAQYQYAQPVAPGGGEAWFSIVIGLIIQLMSARFWSFVASKVSGSAFTWTFSAPDGAPITYTQTVFFIGDLAMVLFGIVLIVEGLVIGFARRPSLVFGAFILTVFATLFNLYYVVSMMGQGYGLQLMSALAVAFGGYIAAYEWRLLQSMRILEARA